MTKRSEATMIAICETIASGAMSYKGAAAASGVSQSTFWGWIKSSQADDPAFIIEWLGERVQFAKAINAARKIALYEIRANLEERAAMGHYEPIFFQGQPTWVEMEECVGIDEDLRELLGYPRDGLKRDADGFRIQHRVLHPSPVALALRVAEMAFPREYRPGSSVEINGAVSLGVTTISRKQAAGGKQLSPPSIPPALAILPDKLTVDKPIDAVDDLNDAADPDEPKGDEALWDEAASDVSDTPVAIYVDGFDADPAPPPLAPAAVVIRDVPSTREQPAPPSPLLAPQSDLVRDLLDRARAKGVLPPTTDRSRDAGR